MSLRVTTALSPWMLISLPLAESQRCISLFQDNILCVQVVEKGRGGGCEDERKLIRLNNSIGSRTNSSGHE